MTSLGHGKSDICLMWPPGYMLVLIEVENTAEAGLVGRYGVRWRNRVCICTCQIGDALEHPGGVVQE